MNVLLKPSSLDYGAVEFDKINEQDFLPALQTGIETAYKRLQAIKSEKNPTFDNIIVAMETAAENAYYVLEIFYRLYSSNCTKEVSEISQKFSEELTKFGNNITLDSDVFRQVK